MQARVCEKGHCKNDIRNDMDDRMMSCCNVEFKTALQHSLKRAKSCFQSGYSVNQVNDKNKEYIKH